MDYAVYTGIFDEQGRTTLEQPTAKKIASMLKNTEDKACIVYAYDESGNECLYQSIAEDADISAYTFGIEAMGWKSYPTFTVYEVEQDDSETESNSTGSGNNGGKESQDSQTVAIRVYDGQIQVYTNNVWVSMGTVEEYVKKDPFRAYEEKGAQGENAGEPVASFGRKCIQGTLPKETAKPVSKPSSNSGSGNNSTSGTGQTSGSGTTSTPSTGQTSGSGTTATPPPTPTPTPTPTPPPTPTPTPTPPSGGGDGGGNSGDNTGGNSGGGSGGNTSGGSDSGNDTDVEWTPDIM